MGTVRSLGALVVVLGVLLCVTAAPLPNIVYITTDDQDLLLGSFDVMPFTSALRSAGADFTHAVVASPVCCPSRTATLTGRYPHNLNNAGLGWCGNFLSDHLNTTFVSVLHDAGYATHLSGKLVNDMGDMCDPSRMTIPAGFDDFFAMCNEVTYYKNTFNDNGRFVTSGTTPTQYLTSLIGNRTTSWLQSRKGSSQPFFAYVAPHAPHLPATPAEWYWNASLPGGQIAPRVPNWNVVSSDKHWLIASQPGMSPFLVNASDTLYRDRLRALLSVDDLVRDIVAALQDIGALDDTVILYTSDHGYHLGSFGVFMEKREPYETDIRIPLFVTGAGYGIAPNASINAIVSNVDVAATILDLAGGLAMNGTDGRSLLPLIPRATDSPAALSRM